MPNIPPVLLSAIICDRVIFDKFTSMPSLINIIQNVNSPRYPLRNSLVFFCELTNGHGKTQTIIRIVDSAEDDKVISDMDAAADAVSDDADSVRLDPNNRDNGGGGTSTG